MFGFYNVDIDYLAFLHHKDSEVEYSPVYRNAPHSKLFLGIITTIDGVEYFIPLTSAKRSHEAQGLKSKNHMLIYEQVDIDFKHANPNKFYKRTNEENKFLLLIASLLFNKMIPVRKDLYSYVDIANELDQEYKNLLIKEYSFCLSNKDFILENAESTLRAIKEGKGVRYSCDLNLLEQEMNNFPIIK